MTQRCPGGYRGTGVLQEILIFSEDGKPIVLLQRVGLWGEEEAAAAGCREIRGWMSLLQQRLCLLHDVLETLVQYPHQNW